MMHRRHLNSYYRKAADAFYGSLPFWFAGSLVSYQSNISDLANSLILCKEIVNGPFVSLHRKSIYQYCAVISLCLFSLSLYTFWLIFPILLASSSCFCSASSCRFYSSRASSSPFSSVPFTSSSLFFWWWSLLLDRLEPLLLALDDPRLLWCFLCLWCFFLPERLLLRLCFLSRDLLLFLAYYEESTPFSA